MKNKTEKIVLSIKKEVFTKEDFFKALDKAILTTKNVLPRVKGYSPKK